MIMVHYKIYVLIALPLFAIHVAEEYLTAFYSVDPSTQFVAAYLNVAPLIVYTSIQVILFLFLSFLIFKRNALLLFLFGLILVLELDHLIQSVILGRYEAVITSIPLLVLGFFFWQKFIKERMLI